MQRNLSFVVLAATVLVGSVAMRSAGAAEYPLVCSGKVKLSDVETRLINAGWIISSIRPRQIATDWRPIALRGPFQVANGIEVKGPHVGNAGWYSARLVVYAIEPTTRVRFNVLHRVWGTRTSLGGYAPREFEWAPLPERRSAESRRLIKMFRTAVCGVRDR
ncbi:MAG: hypothetical protein AAFZ18_23250 [Myxococcota bacterium]